MRSACDNASHMAKMIQIRNVPDDVHRTLKARAASAGMTLSDYLRNEVEQVAARPTLEDLVARLRAKPRTKVKTTSIARIIRRQREVS
jgi:plasmid stability protein